MYRSLRQLPTRLKSIEIDATQPGLNKYICLNVNEQATVVCCVDVFYNIRVLIQRVL
jgi:hypothetical protein